VGDNGLRVVTGAGGIKVRAQQSGWLPFANGKAILAGAAVFIRYPGQVIRQ
jgi:hypothetical protein